MNFTKNLTNIYGSEAEAGKWKTPEGMAHWSGTGPKGTTCRECEFWTGGEERYASAKSGSHAATELKPGQCAKYKQLVGKCVGMIPHRTASCKHFNAVDIAPAITEKPKW